MFYDKFISLCAQKGESPTQVSKNIGLSNAAATGWKNGKKPNDITIKRLADYFGVPVDALKEPENVFYENYLRLCNSVKKSPSAVALEVGLKKSSVTRWKAGGNPTDATAQKIADYFGVPISELTEEKEKAPTLTKKDERDIERRLSAMIEDLNGPIDSLMFDGEPIDDETRQLLEMSLRNQLEISKRIAKQKFTPKKYRKEGE